MWRFSFLFQGFRGSAKRKTLAFSGFPLLFFPKKKQGLEGQGDRRTIAANLFAATVSDAKRLHAMLNTGEGEECMTHCLLTSYLPEDLIASGASGGSLQVLRWKRSFRAFLKGSGEPQDEVRLPPPRCRPLKHSMKISPISVKKREPPDSILTLDGGNRALVIGFY